MREKILKLLEKDARIDFAELAVMIGVQPDAVAAEIAAMIDERVICGFTTLVNWDKTDRECVTAIIEVKVTPQRGQGFDKIAERIYKFDEVTALYLMSGGYDLSIIIEGRTIKDIAYFVSDKLSPLESVLSTATHFVLKTYKDHGVVMDKKDSSDERMIISP